VKLGDDELMATFCTLSAKYFSDILQHSSNATQQRLHNLTKKLARLSR